MYLWKEGLCVSMEGRDNVYLWKEGVCIPMERRVSGPTLVGPM